MVFVLPMQHCVKTNLSEERDNGPGIMPLNSPGGTTLQWNAKRGSLCLPGTTYYDKSGTYFRLQPCFRGAIL